MCDNVGENNLLEARVNSVAWLLGLKFEYNSRSTPQQNSKLEVGFSTFDALSKFTSQVDNICYSRRN